MRPEVVDVPAQGLFPAHVALDSRPAVFLRAADVSVKPRAKGEGAEAADRDFFRGGKPHPENVEAAVRTIHTGFFASKARRPTGFGLWGRGGVVRNFLDDARSVVETA